MINVDGQNVVVCQDDVEIISEDIPGWLVANEGATNCCVGYYAH